ncbi:hypothetical protein K6U70_19870 [Vibrio vulnificus]|uniref:hypothetical protein n=1 Tax=Vibrio vulnificus TaxID=672 RepID=UPI001EEAD6B9|nr:hypothetical protein [Vibrio vulnificus]MCG6274373.1 hypothetical protein [Vibrio vulnificus]
MFDGQTGLPLFALFRLVYMDEYLSQYKASPNRYVALICIDILDHFVDYPFSDRR